MKVKRRDRRVHQPSGGLYAPFNSGIIGHDVLGARALSLFISTWASNTYGTCGSKIPRYFEYYDDQQLAPLSDNPATMACFVT
jgi:hypothetical protein